MLSEYKFIIGVVLRPVYKSDFWCDLRRDFVVLKDMKTSTSYKMYKGYEIS